MISIRTKSSRAHKYMERCHSYKIPIWPGDYIHAVFDTDFNNINSKLNQVLVYLQTKPFEVKIDVDEMIQILNKIIQKLERIKNEFTS